MRSSFMKINWDGLGIGTSLACAIHCAVLPLFFTSVPLLGTNIIHNPWFEWTMILLALGIGINALRHGYLRHHHRILPIVLLTSGFAFLIAKEWMGALHIPFVILAVGLIISAHYLNYRLCRKANHCHANDCDH